MQIPKIASGILEQAVYTWSSRNVTGSRGEGFGAVSAGLEDYKQWLTEFDTEPLRLLDPTMARTEESTWDYSKFVGIGRFRVGGLGIAYKKMADGGRDQVNRPRHVVHLLIGNAADVDLLWTLNHGVGLFSDPEEFPLDRLPKLPTLSMESPLNWVGEDPEEAWVERLTAMAKTVGDARVFSGRFQLLGLQEPDLSLVQCSWLLHPPRLWPYVSMHSFVGRDGPYRYIEPEYPEVLAINPPIHPAVQKVNNLASNLKIQEGSRFRIKSVVDYDLRLSQKGVVLGVPAPGLSAGSPTSMAQGSSLGDYVTVKDVIESVVGSVRAELRSDRIFNEVASQTTLRRLRKNGIAGGELLTFGSEHLTALFAAVEGKVIAKDWADYLSDAPSDQIADAWRSKGVGVLLLALAFRLQDRDRVSAASRRVDQVQLERAVDWILTETDSDRLLVRLLDSGLILFPESRQAVLASLETRPQFLFDKILPQVKRMPTNLFATILFETFDVWADHRRIIGRERAALHSLLNRRLRNRLSWNLRR